jgi:hypothetical protein
VAECFYETRPFPEREYTFKHALTHEVAYGSLLQERQREQPRPKPCQLRAALCNQEERKLSARLWCIFKAGRPRNSDVQCIVKARQAVQDDGAAQRIIKTVQGHGCRFVAVIATRTHDTITPLPPAAHTSAHKTEIASATFHP